MKSKLLLIPVFLSLYGTTSAQLNIVSKNDGLKEFTVQNVQPYDSLANVDNRSFASLPGQILYMHGAKDDRYGYFDAFFTGNFLTGKKYPVYKLENVKSTPAKEVVGRYYEVVKVWTKTDSYSSGCCLLLREKETGDEIYYNPFMYPHCMTCLGYYEKLKRYIGQTFLSLGIAAESMDRQAVKPSPKTEYRCIDIGLEMNSDGAFLILKGADGAKLKGSPVGDEVYEFVSTERITSLVELYGKQYGERIAFRKVDTGMTKEMVVTAWGEPYRKSKIKKEDEVLEIWSFSGSRYVEILNGKVVNIHEATLRSGYGASVYRGRNSLYSSYANSSHKFNMRNNRL